MVSKRKLADDSHPPYPSHECCAPPGNAKVLVVRCCRTPVFANAVATIRGMCPGAEVWGLAQPDYHPELRSILDRLLAYPKRRFSPCRIPLSLLRDIRRARFDVVAIPYMNSIDIDYINVHWMAILFSPSRFVILSVEGDVHRYDSREFRKFVLRNSFWSWLRPFDVPLMFLGLLLALLKRRKRRAEKWQPKQRVLHIINSLGAGGAQVQLAALLDQTPRDRYDVEVLVLYRSDGDFSQFRFKRPDVPISYLLQRPYHSRSLWEIAGLCRINRYDIVHTWLFMSNVLGSAGARLAGCPRIISSVRNLSLWKRTWCNRPWFRLADFLAARLADVVTVNGGSLVPDHARWAFFPQRRIVVVPNGLEADDILPAAAGARKWVRNALGLAPGAQVIGTVGRLAPEKDHPVFLRIVHRLRRDLPSLHAVVVGDGDLRFRLQRMAEDLGLEGCVHFVGERKESRRFIAGFDLFLLTSRIEGFPNVLLEAAFLGVPCLSTDVGASRDILNDPDSVFAAGDAETGYRKAKEYLVNPQAALARARRAQDWAAHNFTAQRMSEHWLSLYEGTPMLGGYACETRSDPVALLP